LIVNDSGTKVTIKAKYLRILFDSELTFVAHRKRATVKAYSNLKALQELAGSAWGSSMTGMRKYIRDW
jgi:hypothetical protein